MRTVIFVVTYHNSHGLPSISVPCFRTVFLKAMWKAFWASHPARYIPWYPHPTTQSTRPSRLQLAATADADGEEVFEDTESAQRQEDAAGQETGVLEQTLEKLIALTQIGFGELSSSVISQRMTATGELDADGEGTRVAALFGVCRIPHFAEVCAALQGQTTLFLNELCRMVHDEVTASGGSVNKNSGSAFVFVWKLPAELTPQRLRQLLRYGCCMSDEQIKSLPPIHI
jgi:hypothetical protein